MPIVRHYTETMDESDYQWYEAKYAMAEKILPILVAYRQGYASSGVALPTWLRDAYGDDIADEDLGEKWISEVDKMIEAFSQLVKGHHITEPSLEQSIEKFGKYYLHFWD